MTAAQASIGWSYEHGAGVVQDYSEALLWYRKAAGLKSFGWGIAALHRLDAATKLPSLAARPIASLGPSISRCPRGEFSSSKEEVRRGARSGARPYCTKIAEPGLRMDDRGSRRGRS